MIAMKVHVRAQQAVQCNIQAVLGIAVVALAAATLPALVTQIKVDVKQQLIILDVLELI